MPVDRVSCNAYHPSCGGLQNIEMFFFSSMHAHRNLPYIGAATTMSSESVALRRINIAEESDSWKLDDWSTTVAYCSHSADRNLKKAPHGLHVA